MARGSSKSDVASRVQLKSHSDDDDESNYMDGAETVAFEVGISPFYLRDNKLTQVALIDGKVAGALWTNISANLFSFDIVVSKDHQKKGIGAKLVDAAVREFNEMKDAYPDLKYQVQVVNESMTRILRKKGFIFAYGDGGGDLKGKVKYMTKAEG